MSRIIADHYTGCLLGGAVGDALGWPVEFESLDEILATHGTGGVKGMKRGKAGLYEITDDTQMTLFTAEGLLRAWAAARHCGSPPDFVVALKRSYLCWLVTQREKGAPESGRCPGGEMQGWLLSVEGLHQRRAPGGTCLAALGEMRLPGAGLATNTSKGCGGVMRAAPAGLLAARINAGDSAGTALLAFEIGCLAAAITHGHPAGQHPAGVLAAVIACILQGESIETGIERSLVILQGRRHSEETIEALWAVLRIFRDPHILPGPETVESLGGGWIGSEALAIGLYCALAAREDFALGLLLAVNHSGDSDSTGSITGNILGAHLGKQAIPGAWLERLELAEVIQRVGGDLFTSFESGERWLERYPPV